VPFPDEVLFLTSSDRIYQAFLDEYEKSDPSNPDNREHAAEWTRRFIRRLKVPTQNQVDMYRRNFYD
jgi:hypothetical protein